MDIKVEVISVDEVIAVVEIGGEMDVFTSPAIKKKVTEVIDSGRRFIIMDLGGVTYIDSTGLGLLISILKRVREKEGDLKIVGVTKQVQKVLDITGLNKILEIKSNVGEAIKDWH
ncbi:MAG: STAS domain-containing protein [bacterium]|jgi:anti-sigma B factor antagonist|nr:STAS domain-containing protein [bacterium]MDD3806256.1 STAS domain-containing protein [bacterium]MDD4152839.1 STAS domain-containing protein [bacterium]MDD4559067.1 STAS domain-containing protein [bacterium]